MLPADNDTPWFLISPLQWHAKVVLLRHLYFIPPPHSVKLHSVRLRSCRSITNVERTWIDKVSEACLRLQVREISNVAGCIILALNAHDMSLSECANITTWRSLELLPRDSDLKFGQLDAGNSDERLQNNSLRIDSEFHCLCILVSFATTAIFAFVKKVFDSFHDMVKIRSTSVQTLPMPRLLFVQRGIVFSLFPKQIQIFSGFTLFYSLTYYVNVMGSIPFSFLISINKDDLSGLAQFFRDLDCNMHIQLDYLMHSIF